MVSLKDIYLSSFSSYQIGGIADIAFPETCDELYNLIYRNNKNGIPYYLFGFGSNLLFPDTPSKKCMFISLAKLNSFSLSNNKLTVSSGFPLSFVAIIASFLKQHELYFTFLLPGSVGAATYINARYFDYSLSDSIHSVSFINNPHCNPEYRTIPKNQCSFAYKQSIFQSNQGIITEVAFNLDSSSFPNFINYDAIESIIAQYYKNPNSFFSLPHFFNYFYSVYQSLLKEHEMTHSQDEFEKIIRDRASKKHFDFPSCGSVFKNNYSVGIPTGKLIDELGLRSYTYGGAQISPHHGNIIINYSNAKAEDVKYLISLIQEKIYDRYGFTPECEVQIID